MQLAMRGIWGENYDDSEETYSCETLGEALKTHDAAGLADSLFNDLKEVVTEYWPCGGERRGREGESVPSRTGVG
jgi:hypothetical protein